MGLPIARNLLAAGYALTVHDRTLARAEELVREGATWADSPAAAARESRIVITMVADDAALEAVAFGESGLVAGLGREAVHVGMITVEPATSRRLADAHRGTGSRYVAAPVFGRPEMATQAKLWVVAAGPSAAVETARPVLQALGRGLSVVGEEPSRANLLKLAGNFLLAAMVEGLGEALTLVEKAGIDRLDALRTLNEALFASPVYQTNGERICRLNDALKRAGLDGLIETVPALRSMLLHYDSRRLPTRELVATLKKLEETVPSGENLNIPSRRVELPIAFGDRWTRADIERYVKYTRQDAPNIVDGHNIEYIARYNGLRNVQEVVDYICVTECWNACIGFWPGLPFMFPLDPRYAIVTPKYNPTRPWTPEGAVGIGGPCVAIYPVASPGGYQLFGRTIPIFDLQQRNPAFKANPILLKPADRIQWVRVTDDELEAIRARVYDGTYRYKVVEYEALNVKAYRRFLDSVKDAVAAFQRRQAEAVKHIPIP